MLKIESIADNARKYLEGRIFRGELHPGQQIKEQEIASFLGISRPPIREALKLLEAEGLITRKPNRGAFVTTITEKDAWEIYILKSDLYELSTRLAFEKISDRDIRLWEETIREMEECANEEPPDIIRYQSLNKRFHDIMIKASGHMRLRKILQIMHNQVKRLSCMSLTNKEHLDESLYYHKRILEAIKARDITLATRLTREHISQGLAIVQTIIAEETREKMRPTGTGGK